MSFFFPNKKLSLESKLSETEITQLMNWFTGEGPIPLAPDGPLSIAVENPFRGIIDENQFTIERAIKYRNSFQPILKGEFIAQGNKCIIHIKIGIARSVRIFLICFYGFIFFGIYKILTQESNTNSLGSSLFTALFLFIGAYALMLYGYRKELNPSIIDLKEILQAEEI